MSYHHRGYLLRTQSAAADGARTRARTRCARIDRIVCFREHGNCVTGDQQSVRPWDAVRVGVGVGVGVRVRAKDWVISP